MIANPIRGACLCAAMLLGVFCVDAHAQTPTPATSTLVVRLLAERALRVRLPLAVAGIRAESSAVAGLTVVAGPMVVTSSAAPESAAAVPTARATALPIRKAMETLVAIKPGMTRGFLARQLEFPRVRRAFETKADRVSRMFSELDVSSPELFFRVFKREQVLEIWTRNSGSGAFELLSTYPVCKLSGRLGPKRRQGDLQIPEGFYEIDLLNPQSEYHLSMRVDYPNEVDRARGAGERLGGDIYIHGGCATIGCVPVTDEWIEEIYVVALQARDAGQETIPVHIFPTRLDAAGLAWLATTYGRRFVDYPFWQNLQEGYAAFETSRTVPVVGYDSARYTFDRPAAAPRLEAVPGFDPDSMPVPIPTLIIPTAIAPLVGSVTGGG